MNIHGIKNKIKEIEEREKKIKNPIKYLKTVLDKSKKTKNYNLKKYITYFLIIFIAINSYIYISLYKANVSNASKNFIDSRISMTNATMFHLYYVFFIKAGIDFQNKILAIFLIPRDYFYEKGLSELPKDDAESAIWFETFKVRPYDYSVNGQHGNMAKLYGVDFTKEFTSKIYNNIEILSTKPLHEYSKFKELQMYAIEKYILLMTIYMNDFHLNPKGELINKKNIMRIHTNKQWYKNFKKLYKLQDKFFTYYKKQYSEDYNRTLDETKGYYSTYADYYINKWLLTTFILYYEKNNNLLSEKSIEYINDMRDSKDKVVKLMFNNRKPTKEQQAKLFGLNDNQVSKMINKINKGKK